MKIDVNEKYLITTSNWFVAPDGEQYKSVHGTVNGILDSERVLGVKTNRGSSNRFISIGNMFVAGCQINYCIKTKHVSRDKAQRLIEFEGKLNIAVENSPRIYDADHDICCE